MSVLKTSQSLDLPALLTCNLELVVLMQHKPWIHPCSVGTPSCHCPFPFPLKTLVEKLTTEGGYNGNLPCMSERSPHYWRKEYW